MTQAEKAVADPSSREPARVSVRILEKEYAMVCPYEERSALLDSAEFLNARMREVRETARDCKELKAVLALRIVVPAHAPNLCVFTQCSNHADARARCVRAA